MRRERIIARILLLFTVANVALAAPAVVRQRHLDVAKAARKRGNAGSQITVSGITSSGSAYTFPNPYHPSGSEDDVDSLSRWLPESQDGSSSVHLNSEPESQVTAVGSNSEHLDFDRESLSGGLAHDSTPESNGVITSDLTQKLKKVSIWGAIAAISAGVTYKILKKTGFSRIDNRMRALPSMVLPDKPQPRENSVSWGLGKI